MTRRHAEDEHNPASENLLALDGYVFVIDEVGEYWVKFEVQRVSGRRNGLMASSIRSLCTTPPIAAWLGSTTRILQSHAPSGAGQDRWTIGIGWG